MFWRHFKFESWNFETPLGKIRDSVLMKLLESYIKKSNLDICFSISIRWQQHTDRFSNHIHNKYFSRPQLNTTAHLHNNNNQVSLTKSVYWSDYTEYELFSRHGREGVTFGSYHPAHSSHEHGNDIFVETWFLPWFFIQEASKLKQIFVFTLLS